MDIVEFNTNSNILFEKYTPVKINDIIGSSKQTKSLIDWLKNYEQNAKNNLKVQTSKTFKKPRKRKQVCVKKNIDDDILNDEDKSEDEDDIILVENDENNDDDYIIALNSKKKKDPKQCSCAIITGDHGTGKTAIVKAILNDLGYQIRVVNFAKINMNVKSTDEFVENILLCGEIFDNLGKKNAKSRKFAIIVDEIQSVITPTEKSIIMSLSKINSEIWGAPVVFIGSNKHKKIMTGIKKECYHISLYPPTNDDMMLLLEKICIGEKMQFEGPDCVKTIVAHGQNDFRRLIVIIGELYRIHKTNVITLGNINDYMKFTGDKDVDRSIFENTTRLFSKYKDVNSSLKIFGLDKTNMPLMVHQNHFLATNGYITNRKKLIDISYDITDNLARGDVVENYVYSDQNWTLQETYGFYSCVYPSYTINKNINVSKLSNDSRYPYYAPTFSAQYPKDLNRTSTRCINYKKNIKPANDFFKNMNIDDYILIVKTIKNLLDDGKVKECKELLKEYNITQQGIMYILKMDKINGTKKDVPKNIENKVKHIATDPVRASVIKKY